MVTFRPKHIILPLWIALITLVLVLFAGFIIIVRYCFNSHLQPKNRTARAELQKEPETGKENALIPLTLVLAGKAEEKDLVNKSVNDGIDSVVIDGIFTESMSEQP